MTVSAWYETQYRYDPDGLHRGQSFDAFVRSPGGYGTVLALYRNWAHNATRLSRYPSGRLPARCHVGR